MVNEESRRMIKELGPEGWERLSNDFMVALDGVLAKHGFQPDAFSAGRKLIIVSLVYGLDVTGNQLQDGAIFFCPCPDHTAARKRLGFTFHPTLRRESNDAAQS